MGRRVVTVLVVSLLAAVSLVGCKGSSGDPVKPTINGAILAPNPDSVLSASLRFTTTPATAATLHIDGPSSRLTPMAERTPARRHEIPVVGLRAATAYAVWVEVRGANGGTTRSRKLSFRTGKLPSDLPPIDVKSQPSRMAPGVTLFDATRR